ncbi:hypothetical protein C6495_02060 [Candidatus Poribacteria bacterium]|nr:MAG: hypothetical protein C6495_02060 [Candidatus Poribacteria bacterium]
MGLKTLPDITVATPLLPLTLGLPMPPKSSDRKPHRQRQPKLHLNKQGEEQRKRVQPEMWQGKLAPRQSQCNKNSPPRKECVRD